MKKNIEGTAKEGLALGMYFLCPENNKENNIDDLQWERDSGWFHRDQIMLDFESQYSFHVWWNIFEELWAKKWYIQIKRISWTNSLESIIKALKME